MTDAVRIETPLTTENVAQLRIGDRVLLSGFIYSARDAAHHLLVELLKKGHPLPFDISGQVVRRLSVPTGQADNGVVLRWDGRLARGSLAPAGVYYVRIEAGDQTASLPPNLRLVDPIVGLGEALPRIKRV